MRKNTTWLGPVSAAHDSMRSIWKKRPPRAPAHFVSTSEPTNRSPQFWAQLPIPADLSRPSSITVRVFTFSHNPTSINPKCEPSPSTQRLPLQPEVRRHRRELKRELRPCRRDEGQGLSRSPLPASVCFEFHLWFLEIVQLAVDLGAFRVLIRVYSFRGRFCWYVASA
jgi:hypothetical protein